MEKVSLLYPGEKAPEYKELPFLTAHDLSLDQLAEQVARDKAEAAIIFHYLTHITSDPEVAAYRTEIFTDVLSHPSIRSSMKEILERIDFLRQFGSFQKLSDASGAWELVHRMGEMDEYILCVEGICKTLSELPIRSRGLKRLLAYAMELHEEAGFTELKKDIEALKKETSEVRSVTLGVNLNDRFEPSTAGIVSVNSRYFTKSNVISNLSDFIAGKEKQSFSFQPAQNDTFRNPTSYGNLFGTMVLLNPEDRGNDVLRSMDRAISHMISKVVKKLKSVISRHVDVSTLCLTGLIPEFMYYIRFAEYLESMKKAGFSFAVPEALTGRSRSLKAEGLYNLKLADEICRHPDGRTASDVVRNPLDFSKDRRIYIFTGANRGGKTTFTQGIGLAFVLAQGGIHVPADSFVYDPVDNIYTHYPADENETMDLGRLGEETKRFRELFHTATKDSLLLLNESFSTTSFEEGYFIARDVVRALKHMGVRTIYNTHMHKLALEIDAINDEEKTEDLAASLVARSVQGKRSFQIEAAPPEGQSYARDIAQKYGVTFEQLMKEGCQKP